MSLCLLAVVGLFKVVFALVAGLLHVSAGTDVSSCDNSDSADEARCAARPDTKLPHDVRGQDTREALCDGSALPEFRPDGRFFNSQETLQFAEGREITEPEELQALYAQYTQPFKPEGREANGVQYWSCNVEIVFKKEPVMIHDWRVFAPGLIPVNPLRDCDALPWLAQFLQNGEWRSVDVGADHGECAYSLLAIGHHVTLVDAEYDQPYWRTWVQMTLDANNWRNRTNFVNSIAAFDANGLGFH